MLPEITRTGRVEIKEQGFTSYFSVDGEAHSFSTRYYDNDWRPFPDHLKRKLGQLISSVWVAAIPSQEKVFTHRLSEADIKYLKYISYQTQGLYRMNMRYPSLESDPTLHVTPGETDWSDLDLKEDSCGVYFSGGRDAFCTLGLLEDAGYDPHLMMFNNGSSWDAGENARNYFEEEGRDVNTAWNNFSLLKREITKEHGIFWHLEAPIFQMTWLMSLPMLEHKLNFFGNEATTTRYTSVGKDKILHHSWEQSVHTNQMMTEWSQKEGIGQRVGSIVREMDQYRIMKELYERFPDYWEHAVSCFFVNKDDDYSPCSKCHKCQRNYLVLKAIGGDTSQYDEERIEEYGKDPSDLLWKTMLPNDLSHVNYHIDRYPDYPNQKRREVEGAVFKEERTKPTHFLTRKEFKRVYSSVMDDDECWVLSEPGPKWIPVEDLDHMYDVVEDFETPELGVDTNVENNNSLLNL